ncbi:MAG TPA: TolC family protein, partial [Gemmataceae bacterium]|nr:TolC family protein [Gemmataceae bacterium]
MAYRHILSAGFLLATLAIISIGTAQEPKKDDLKNKFKIEDTKFPPVPTFLDENTRLIDLSSALQLAGVQNPQILLARQRVTEAVALRQLAAAQFLPSINVGSNVDVHNGVLQQANGNILPVNRDAMYVGLGANAVAAGTPSIPGLFWSGNVSTTIYNNLISKQVVRQREFTSVAVRNDMLLRVAQAYLELLRSEGHRAIAEKNRDQAMEIARLTANFAKLGQGRQADADRAATELEQRNTDLMQAEADMLTSSARLAQLLSLDPSVRLKPADYWVVPQSIVPDPIPTPELIAIAMVQRPELGAQQAAIRAAFLDLRSAKVLPFSPNVILGYSAGGFGGGSNLLASGFAQPSGAILTQPRFTPLGQRQDIDAIMYWTVRNLGLGNVAQIRIAQSNLAQKELRNIEILNQVRSEVVLAYARTHVRYAQIETNERAIKASQKAFEQDSIRTKNR